MDNNEQLRIAEAEMMAEVMARGGLTAGPTDTVWGLGCSAVSADAVKRLLSLKQRPAGKPMLVLVGSREAFSKLAGMPYPDSLSTDRPTTVIVPEPRMQLAPGLVAEDGSLGIRVVESGFASDVCNALGVPMVSTSANFSGQPTPAFFEEIDPEILQMVDHVSAVGRQTATTRPQPSRIVKLSCDGEVVVLRQ